ncbi:ABC transporter permease [Bacillus alkalicellulosilyticus]|uniref:ABC transporter permease n=1 Tax=Alkalihalobacterium alkalicellulosilyticum TaxID=1912214 RepID=UPI00099636E8|nr:ABC transporter permease [Bacillus alkalicellulosilyticus]
MLYKLWYVIRRSEITQTMKSLIWLTFEMKNMVADKKVVAFLICGPLLLLIILGYLLAPFFVEEGNFEKIDIALVNHDNSNETKMILRHFMNNEDVKRVIELSQVKEQAARDMLLHNEVAAVIIVPEGFSRDLARGINTPITVLGNHQRPLQSKVINHLMQSGINMVNASQSGINTVYFYMQDAQVDSEQLQRIFQESIVSFTLHSLGRQEIWEKRSISPYGEVSIDQYFVTNLGFVFLFFIGLLGVRIGTSDSLLLERRLLSLGVGSIHIVFTRWMSLSLFICLPYFLYYGSVGWLFKDYFTGSIPLVMIYSVVSILTISALFISISMCFKNMVTVNVISFFLILMLPLIGGTIIPLAYLPLWVEKIHVLSLSHWLSQGAFLSFFSQEQPVFWISVFVLFLFTFFLLTVTTVIHKQRREL